MMSKCFFLAYATVCFVSYTFTHQTMFGHLVSFSLVCVGCTVGENFLFQFTIFWYRLFATSGCVGASVWHPKNGGDHHLQHFHFYCSVSLWLVRYIQLLTFIYTTFNHPHLYKNTFMCTNICTSLHIPTYIHTQMHTHTRRRTHVNR